MKIEFDDYTFNQTARVLMVINEAAAQLGYDGLLRYMKDETEVTLQYNPECDFWGTLGFYVLMSKRANGDYYAEAVLMPFTVESYLQEKGVMPRENQD